MWYSHAKLLGVETNRTTYSVSGTYRQVFKMADKFWLVSINFSEDIFFLKQNIMNVQLQNM